MLVIGGGLTGMGASYGLAKKGYDVSVDESEEQLVKKLNVEIKLKNH